MFSARFKLLLFASFVLFLVSFAVQKGIVIGALPPSYLFHVFDFVCTIIFIPVFVMFFMKFKDGKAKVQDELEKENEEMSFSADALIEEIMRKNTYLEYAAKILRHDMHSGINTYLPRGLRSLKRRLTPEAIRDLKLEAPLQLMTDGLEHTQQVYKGVFEFTNLVREKSPTIMYQQVDIAASLKKYFKRTAYADQIIIGPLNKVYVNEALFCTAIDNLVRNGLKYNDSETKWIKIEQEDEYTITITDNGRGMSQEEFESYSQAYKRGTNQKESGTGLGLNISIAIFKEHYFEVSAEKLEVGTKIRIKM